MPKVIIIAGPNGAGKTTFAKSYLPVEAGVIQFVNADMIAAGISPFDPTSANVAAGRVMLERLQDLVEDRRDFALETTLSGRWLAKQITGWKAAGYEIELYYLKLSTVEVSFGRIRQRVKNGGHNIPEEVARRRFDRSLGLLEDLYKNLVDLWSEWDNGQYIPLILGSERMASITTEQSNEMPEQLKLALQAMRRGVRQAFLNGEAYDPDGRGKAYWETHDEFCQPITDTKSA